MSKKSYRSNFQRTRYIFNILRNSKSHWIVFVFIFIMTSRISGRHTKWPDIHTSEQRLLFTLGKKEGSVARDNRPWSSLDRERILTLRTHLTLLSLHLTSQGSKMPLSEFRKKKLLFVFNAFFGKYIITNN